MASDRSPEHEPERPPSDRAVGAVAAALLSQGTEPCCRALQALSADLPFAWAGLALGDADGLSLVETYETTPSGLGPSDPPPLRLGPVVVERGPVDVDPVLGDLLASRGLPSVLAVAAGAHPAGVLLLAREEAFSPADEALASAVAGLLAAERHRSDRERFLESRLEERTAELSGVYEICRSLGHALDVEGVERLVLDAVERLMAPAAAALLVDVPGHRRVVVRLGRPVSDERIAALRAAVETEHGARGGEPGRDLDLRVHRGAGFAERAPLAGRPDEGLTAPVMCRGRTVGLLRIDPGSQTMPPPDAARLLHTVLSQAEMSLDRILTLREREESRLDQLLDSLPQGVLLASAELEVLVANPSARGLLARLCGGDAPHTLRKIAGLDMAALARRVLTEGQDRANAEVSTGMTGRIIALSVAPVRGRRGADPTGIVLVLDDVTEARHLQEQMVQTEKLTALGEMIAGVAHELNNPLATVMGFAQLLKRNDLGEEVNRRVGIMEEEARRCQRIVQNLLSFVGRRKPEKTLLALGPVLESVLQLVRYQLKVANVQTEVVLDPSMPAIFGDQHALQQVFINLVTNAQHAIAESAGERRLRIQGRPHGDRVVLEISDTGSGIALEHVGRIFDPFFTTKEPGRGTGLGLSLVHKTVRDHGGEIRVDSEPGNGTTFVLEFPVAQLEHATHAREVPETAGDTVRGKTILVVEDEANVAEVLVETLEHDGARVEVAGDGEQAQRRLEAGGIDLIISDLRMPRVDGRELYRRLERDNPDLARRVVFASGDVVSPDTRTFFERTGNPVLSKPFDLQEVRRVVARALRDH